MSVFNIALAKSAVRSMVEAIVTGGLHMFYKAAGCIVALLASSSALAMTDAAGFFGSREGVEQASLSPDGTHLAFIQPVAGQGANLYIADLAQPAAVPRQILHAEGNPERLSDCHWTSNKRLLCSIYGVVRLGTGEDAYTSRAVALDLDGANMQILSNRQGSGTPLGYSLFGGAVIDWNAGAEGHVLMMRQYVPERTIGTKLAQTADGIGVDDVNTANLKARAVEHPEKGAQEYISDGKGSVRVKGVALSKGIGYTTGEVRYMYRTSGDRDWKPLSKVDAVGNGFDPSAVVSDMNVAFGLKRIDGRLAAVSVSLDGMLKETVLYAHPDVDIDGFIHMGRQRRIIGVSYATDKREAYYFDPALRKLATSLNKALPLLPLIRFVDSSQDETKLLIWAGADNDPGRYFLFDRAAKKLTELMLTRPALEKIPLATVKPVSYKAADGTTVPAYLTLPPRGKATGLPAIVMPHGGPGARDEWGFDWLAQYFANQGYAVLQPNFRGSAGYGDQWFRKNGFKDWRLAIGDIDDGARWLTTSGIAAPAKIAIFGWSYGGYAALQSGVTEPGLFKAIIAVAPVTDLERLKSDRRNWSDFVEVSQFIGSGPHVAAGSPARHAAAIKAPVLLFHGTVDRNVDVGHSQLMRDALKDAGVQSELVIFKNLDHYLEDSDARTELLRKSTALLRQTIGAGEPVTASMSASQ